MSRERGLLAAGVAEMLAVVSDIKMISHVCLYSVSVSILDSKFIT